MKSGVDDIEWDKLTKDSTKMKPDEIVEQNKNS